MKAVVFEKSEPPNVLQFQEAAKSVPKDNERAEAFAELERGEKK